MTAVLAAGRRFLPRGWSDLGRQLVIWFGFLLAYQVARGIADRDPVRAFENGLNIAAFEEKVGGFLELTLQNLAHSSELLTMLVSWSYWHSQFTVVGLSLLWVYLRRHDAFTRFRNWILLANVLGLIGYVALPTAPPRMFANFGFEDTLAAFGGLSHGSGLVELASNPYAAMPSLHAADAIIVAVTLVPLCRNWWTKALWAFWPAWVWFAVMATANHFWVDCVAGAVVVLAAWAILDRRRLRQRLRR